MIWALAAAGGVGALARFLIDAAVARRHRWPFPTGIMIANVVGSLLLGVLAGFAGAHSGFGDAQRVLGTGFCGGFTTFSTASVDAVRQSHLGFHGRAVGYGAVTLVAACAAAALGFWLGGL